MHAAYQCGVRNPQRGFLLALNTAQKGSGATEQKLTFFPRSCFPEQHFANAWLTILSAEWRKRDGHLQNRRPVNNVICPRSLNVLLRIRNVHAALNIESLVERWSRCGRSTAAAHTPTLRCGRRFYRRGNCTFRREFHFSAACECLSFETSEDQNVFRTKGNNRRRPQPPRQ